MQTSKQLWDPAYVCHIYLLHVYFVLPFIPLKLRLTYLKYVMLSVSRAFGDLLPFLHKQVEVEWEVEVAGCVACRFKLCKTLQFLDSWPAKGIAE